MRDHHVAEALPEALVVFELPQLGVNGPRAREVLAPLCDAPGEYVKVKS